MANALDFRRGRSVLVSCPFRVSNTISDLPGTAVAATRELCQRTFNWAGQCNSTWQDKMRSDRDRKTRVNITQPHKS